MRAYAAAQGWTVNACYIDPGVSGAKLNRPGLEKLIADCREKKVSKVVTYKLDRLSRSLRDTLYLIDEVFIKNGVDYISMTESFDTGSPVGRAVLHLLAVFAEFEREQIRERMLMGRIASAKEGNWRGGSGVPIGYRYLARTASEDGQLVVDEYEAGIVREVFDRFLAGETFHAIWADMNEKYTTAYGKFGAGGAARVPAILENRTYIGEIRYCGQWYKGKHEPIIDAETFSRAQDKLVDYRAALDEHKRQPFKADHLLSGFLFCGECGARWAYHSCSYTRRTTGERVVYGTYTCYTKNAHKAQRRADRCSLPVWPAAELEDIVWEQLLSLSFDDFQPAPNADDKELQRLEKLLKEIMKKQGKLIDLYTLDTLPLEVIEAKAEKLQAEKEKTEQQIDVLRRRSTRLTAEQIRGALENVQEIYESGDIQRQRDLLRLLVRRITLGAGRSVTIEWNI